MKIFRLMCAGLLLMMAYACDNPFVQHKHQSAQYPAKGISPKTKLIPLQHDTLCITAVGDIMLGTSFPTVATLPPDSGKSSFRAIEKYLQNSDITFGNLEGTLLDTGAPAHYKMHLRSTAYLFRMPKSYGTVLKEAGFNVLSLANNHIYDFGDNGCISTTKTLDSCNISYGGLLSSPTAVFTSNGTTYGFCAFAPNAGTLSILDLKNARKIITQLKQQSDIVIVAFHGGGEGPLYEHITFTGESFFGQKRGDVHAFAHNAIDAGADVVLGTGPHVSRAIELYNNRFIAYSLGNFCTYRSVSVAGVCGIAPLLKLYLDKKGEFLKGRIIAVKQTREKGLETDSLNRVITRIKYLTIKDFPDGDLMISDDGIINIK